jgi:hypothetical protein
MTGDVVGRVVLSDPATLHGGVGPVMLELHADGTTTWRPIYQSAKGRKFAPKPEALFPRKSRENRRKEPK